MKSEIKSILAESNCFDESFHPENVSNFSFLLRVMLGPEGEDSEESFDIEVCSIKWIEDKLKGDEVMIGRHTIIMKEYNFKLLENKILKLFTTKEGNNWREIATYFSRFGNWEFEDYQK